MTPEEILEKAKSGDLAGQDLSKSVLKKADLAGAKLAGADLSRSKLAKANLAGADLSKANLTRADLKGADLSGADLSGATLEKTVLDGAKLDGANLTEANLTGASLRNAEMENVNAAGAVLIDALLSGAKVIKGDFGGADFTRADAVESNWEECRLASAKVGEAIFQNSGFEKCDLRGIEGAEADFSLCAIQESDLSGAKLPSGDFSNTLLEKTSFKNAELNEAAFTVSEQREVDLTDANIQGANFRSVSGYTEEELAVLQERGAKIDRFVMRRIFRFIRAHKTAQLAIVLVVVGVGYFVNAWFNDPHNWSFEKLDRYAQDVRSRNEFDNAIVYYDIMIDKYAQNPIRVAHALNQKAYMLLGKKDIKPARALFQQVVDQFPDQDSAIIVAEIGVADTYRDEKKYDKAVELYEAFAKKWADFPQSVDAYDRIAKIYAADGKVDKALEVYDQIINRYASDAGTILRAEFDKANLMKTQGEYKAASAMFESIVKNYVDVPNTAARAMVGIIECKLLLDEIEEAKALLQKLRYDYPDQNEAAMDAEIYVANAEAQTGDAAEAEARYKKLMETSSDSLQALWAGSRLAALYATVGRNDEALATYDTLIERYKDEPEQRNQLRIERAQLLVQMNRYDDAVAALTALAEEAENNEQRQAAALILGQTYMAMRAFDQAIATYEGLRAESPDDKGIEVKVLLGTGAINREQGKYDEAIAKFRRAIEMSDDSAVVFEAYFQIEAAYRDSGQLEKEQAVLEETAKRFANDPTRLSQVRLALAEVMRKRGQFDEAEKILETVARDDDAARAVSALNALVRLHMETGNEEKAAEITAQIQERFPNNTTAQLDAKMDRAAGFMAEGREDEAVALYQQVADSGDGRRRQSALTALMNYNVEKKDFDQVDKIYQTLLDEYGQDPNAEFSAKLTMAGALRTRNRHDEAAKIYEELLKKAPDQHAAASVLDGMAGVDIERKDYDGAREKLQKILTDYSDDQFADERYRARLSLAAVNEMQLDYKAAAQEYDKAIELAQNEEAEAQARASRVRVTAELGQLDQANQFADALAKDFPDKKELHAQVDGYIAQALASRGRVDEAVQRYDNVAANASTDEAKAYALAQVVQIQAGAGQVREAQERFDNLKRSFPDQVKYLEDAHFALARSQATAGDFDRAAAGYREIIEKANEADPKIRALSALAEVHLNRGRVGDARQIYTKMADDFPDTPAARIEANRGIANIDRSQGRYDDAVAALRKNVADDVPVDERVAALNTIATIYTEQSRFDDAKAVYDEIEKLSPGQTGMQVNSELGLVRVLQQNRQFDEAKAKLEQIIERAPDEGTKANARMQIAGILTQQGQPEEALKIYDALGSEFPDNKQLLAQTQIGKAETLRSMERLDEARQTYETVAESAPDAGARQSAMSAVGQILAEQENYDAAIDQFQKLANQQGVSETTRLDAQLAVADVYSRRGDHGRAIAAYKKVRDQATDDRRKVWADLAIAQTQIGARQFDQAIESYRAVKEAYPNNYQAQIDAEMGMANALKEKQRYDEALASYRRVVEQYPESTQAYWAMMGIAQIQALQGKLEESTKTYETISAKYPQNAQSQVDSKLNMANNLRSANQKTEAIAAYQEIVDNFPGTTQAALSMEAIAQIYAENNEPDKAEETYNKLIEAFKDKPANTLQARFGLANLLAMRGKQKEAIAAYQKLLGEAGTDAEKVQAQIAIANTHMAIGEYDDARKIFEQMMRDYGNQPQVVEQARMGLGGVYMALQKPDQAAKMFEDVAEGAGNEQAASGALVSYAGALIEQGKLDKVDAVVKEIKERFPTDQNAVINTRMSAARKLRSLGRLDEALAQLEPVIRDYAGQPQTAWAMHAKAQILTEQHNPEGSNEIYHKIIEDYSNNKTALIDAQLGIANNAREAGDLEDAVKRYEQVAESNPQYAQTITALTNLSQIYQEQGKDKQLESTLKRLIDMPSGDDNTKANALINLAALYGRQRRIQEALTQYKTVYDSYPEMSQAAWAKLSAARLLNESGQQSEAVDLLESIVAELPETHEAHIGAKAELDRIYKR